MMLLRIIDKLSIPLPTFHLHGSHQTTPVETLYPPSGGTRTVRYSMISNASTLNEYSEDDRRWSTSSDEPATPDEEPIKEVIPMIPMNSEQELHRVAHRMLQQCADVLRMLPSDSVYAWESRMIPKSSIGKQVRHTLEHFRLLLENHPLASDDKGISPKVEDQWNVDYDNRSRDKNVETLRQAAFKHVQYLQNLLKHCSSIPLSKPVHLQATVDANMLIAPVPLQSTYGRELWFCISHAIHHFALIRAICLEQGIVCSEDFGVAPSTLRNWRKEGKQW